MNNIIRKIIGIICAALVTTGTGAGAMSMINNQKDADVKVESLSVQDAKAPAGNGITADVESVEIEQDNTIDDSKQNTANNSKQESVESNATVENHDNTSQSRPSIFEKMTPATPVYSSEASSVFSSEAPNEVSSEASSDASNVAPRKASSDAAGNTGTQASIAETTQHSIPQPSAEEIPTEEEILDIDDIPHYEGIFIAKPWDHQHTETKVAEKSGGSTNDPEDEGETLEESSDSTPNNASGDVTNGDTTSSHRTIEDYAQDGRYKFCYVRLGGVTYAIMGSGKYYDESQFTWEEGRPVRQGGVPPYSDYQPILYIGARSFAMNNWEEFPIELD